MMKKDFYVAPESEVLEMAFEQAILNASALDPGFGDPGLDGMS